MPETAYTQHQLQSLWIHFDSQNTARHVGWWEYMTAPLLYWDFSCRPKDTHNTKWAIATATRSMPWHLGNELPRERMLTIQVNHKNKGHTSTQNHFNFNSSRRIQGQPCLCDISLTKGSRRGSLAPSPSQDLLPFISSCTNFRAALIWAKCSIWLQGASPERPGQ